MLIIGERGNEVVACVSTNGGESFTCKPMPANYSPGSDVLFKGDMVMIVVTSAVSIIARTIIQGSRQGL